MLKIENLTKIYGENVKKRAYPAEGKNIWLIQSLPVKTRDILNAKLAVQLILIV